MIELALRVVEAADHRPHGAGSRIHRDECAFDLGQLRDRPVALCVRVLHEPDHRAAPDLRLRVGSLGQSRRGRLQAFAGDRHRLAALQHGDHLLRAGLEGDGCLQLVVVGMIDKRFGDARIEVLGVRRQVDVILGTAVDLAPLVVHDALAQRPVGDRLLA